MSISDMHNPATRRIESIDVLRAVVLLGILTVHCFSGFGIERLQTAAGGYDAVVQSVVSLVLDGKCNPAFGTLFGVSFYLILRNKSASTARFVWRCVILICIGLFNKLFYWYDVLMLYGAIGIILAMFRNMSVRLLYFTSALCLALGVFVVPSLHLSELLFPGRSFPFMPAETSFRDIISRPLWQGVEAYLDYILHNGGLRALSCALFGYAIGKAGLIARLQTIITTRLLILCWVLTLISLYIRLHTFGSPVQGWYVPLDCTLACLTYCLTVMYEYYRLHGRWLGMLAPYGRMGLTNYTCQAIVSVFCFSASGLSLSQVSVGWLILYITCLYTLQVLFSTLWLRYMKYGPLEWLWRCATQCRYISNKL